MQEGVGVSILSSTQVTQPSRRPVLSGKQLRSLPTQPDGKKAGRQINNQAKLSPEITKICLSPLNKFSCLNSSDVGKCIATQPICKLHYLFQTQLCCLGILPNIMALESPTGKFRAQLQFSLFNLSHQFRIGLEQTERCFSFLSFSLPECIQTTL